MSERDLSLKDFRLCLKTEVTRQSRDFQSFMRRDDSVGTRSYTGILSTVNCSATVAWAAKDSLDQASELSQLGFDGVVAITHDTGRATNTESEGFAFLERVIAGYAQHPNFIDH